MRLLRSLYPVVVFLACIYPVSCFAQAAAEEPGEPYHKHHDMRNGHNHAYPDRGAVVRDLPRGATVVNYAGLSYRFVDGVWFEPRGPAFIVVAPPIGLVVPSLPPFATTVASGGQSYLYANDTYYQPRPDLAGFEVVNDPVDTAAIAGSVATVATPAAAPATPAVVTPIPVATAAPSAAFSPPAPAAPASSLPSATAFTATAPPAAIASPSLSPILLSGSPVSTTTPLAPAAAPVAAPVAMPISVASAPAPTSAQVGGKMVAYPRAGESLDDQARDRYECYQFAVAQTGFDPVRTNGGVPPAQIAERQSNYERAQAACFEGRGYTIR